MNDDKKLRLEIQFRDLKKLLIYSQAHMADAEMAMLYQLLAKKVDAMIARENYSKWKNPNLSPEERERARIEYVEQKGIHEDFRH